MIGSPPGGWILLRGLGREHAHWGSFLARWRAAFPDASLATPDLPGCGDENDQTTPLAIDGVLAAVRKKALASTHAPVGLVGLSLGGMVALAWAQAHADEVAAVAIINSSVATGSSWWQRVRPAAVAALVRAAATTDIDARERRLLSLVSNRPELHDETAAAWAAIARDRPIRRATALRQMLAAGRFRPSLVPAVTPTLVLVSQRDRLVNPTCSHTIATALGTPMRVHPTAGHDLPLDDPAWVVEQATEWWRQVAPMQEPAPSP